MLAPDSTATAGTAPRRRAVATLPTCPVALLAHVQKMDTERRTRAVLEHRAYTLTSGATLTKVDGTSYAPDRYAERAASPLPWFTGCQCADCKKTIKPLLEAMTAAGIGTALACKHHYIRLLWMGQPVRIGSSTYRAKLAISAAPVVPFNA